MKNKIAIYVALLLTVGGSAFAQSQQERLKQHVYILAADSLQGRSAGSEHGLRAAQYIVRQYREMGLKPYFDDYLQPFDNNRYRNVIGVIEGCDPVLKNEFIVIGAHYDHLGVRGGQVYNGADDNASGTAAVIEIARALLARQGELKRSILLVNFDAEEIGLHGSEYLAGTGNPADVRLMMSLDMVGWLRAGKTLRFAGCGMLKDCSQMLQEVADQQQMPIETKKFDNFIFGGTDSDPYAQRQVPALHVTTGLKSPYHKPGDDADLIDYEGLDRVTTYLAEAIVRFASAPQLESTGRQALKHRDQMRPFEAGLLAGYGNSSLLFPDGGFTSQPQLGWHAGALMRMNIRQHLALQLEGYYDSYRTSIPDKNAPYSQKVQLRQSALTVPLSLQLQAGKPMYAVSVGAGPYYARMLSSEAPYGWEANPNQWGWHFTFGVRIARFLVQGQTLMQLNDPFCTSDASDPLPEIGLSRYQVSLIYLF